MLALTFDLKRKVALALLVATTTLFVSCAAQKDQVRLVNDPEDQHESSIPWNKQEKWETGGQFAGMTDRR
jgi:hypothetical protein